MNPRDEGGFGGNQGRGTQNNSQKKELNPGTRVTDMGLVLFGAHVLRNRNWAVTAWSYSLSATEY